MNIGSGRYGDVRLAVIGMGYWGPNIARNVAVSDFASLVALCDRDTHALELTGRGFPGVRLEQSFSDLISWSAVDGVCICTPVSSHYRLALEALEAGKHVLVEKPIATSSSEVRHLMEVAVDRGLTLMPGHTFLYSPPVNVVNDLIRNGDLGDVHFISTSRVNLGIHQTDVSVVWDLAPHDFSILLYWLQEHPDRVGAWARGCVDPAVSDVAFINLRFPSGAIAHAELSWLAPSKLRRTVVVGSEKMVVYDDTSAEPVRIFDSGVVASTPKSFGEYRMTYRTGDIVSPRVSPAEPLALELADFCAAIRDGVQPRSSVELGAAVVALIEAANESLGLGGVPVDTAARAEIG